MVSRLAGPGITLFWLASMGWLVWHDVWPVWTAHDPPRSITADWITEERRDQQARIEDKYGQAIGTIWSRYRRSGEACSRDDLIVIDRFPAISPVRIEVDSQFDTQGRLDELSASVYVQDFSFQVRAERFGSQLAFEFISGATHQTLKLADADAGMIGELFSPFPAMPDLQVGQTWRMQVVNPLAAVLGKGSRFIPLIVRVTGRDMVQTPDGPVECLVVEAPNARALVGPDGTVHVQEMELPVGGRIVIRNEPFDEAAYTLARSHPPPGTLNRSWP